MILNIKTHRVEQTEINRNHPMYNTIKDFSMRSKNMYNYANWFVRQCFIREGYWLKHQEMQTMFKNDKPYKELMSQSSQCVLQVLERNWKSFFEGMKQYNKDKSKFLGMPKLPKYLDKDKGWTWFLKNNNTYIQDGRLYFRLRAMQGYSFKTSVTGRLISVRFVPRNDVFILEIVYEKEIDIKTEFNNNYASIDFGVDNLITMSNNIGQRPILIKGGYVKSKNQWYNKIRAEEQSKLSKNGLYWNKYLDRVTRNRYNQIKNYFHHTTKFIVDYCVCNRIDNLVVGLNETWKQEVNLGNRINQNFIFLPYDMIIKQLEYKCQENGIRLIKTEESYTSGTSVLDNELPIKENYDKKRRIKRGLFKSNEGVLINSDVNGSMQILKKVNPNAFNSHGLEGSLNPIVIKNIFDCYKLVG